MHYIYIYNYTEMIEYSSDRKSPVYAYVRIYMNIWKNNTEMIEYSSDHKSPVYVYVHIYMNIWIYT